MRCASSVNFFQLLLLSQSANYQHIHGTHKKRPLPFLRRAFFMCTDTVTIYRVSIPRSRICFFTASIGTSSLWKIPEARVGGNVPNTEASNPLSRKKGSLLNLQICWSRECTFRRCLNSSKQTKVISWAVKQHLGLLKEIVSDVGVR